VFEKGTATYNLDRNGLIRKHQNEGDYIFSPEYIDKHKDLKNYFDEGLGNRKIKDNKSYKMKKEKLLENKTKIKKESIKDFIKNKKEIFFVNLSIKDMNDKIEVINDNTIKAEKCLEMDMQEFNTAKKLWSQYLDSLDKKLQDLVKMTDQCFKEKELYLNDLNILKENYKNLDREVEKLKVEYEERKSAYEFIFSISNDNFKKKFEENRINYRKIEREKIINLRLLIWELTNYDNTSVNVEQFNDNDINIIKNELDKGETFVTGLDIQSIDVNEYDNSRK